MRKHYLTLLLLTVCSALSAQLVLTETLFDPASSIEGDANRDGTKETFGDEFIELVNTGSSNLDISGYKIYDRNNFELLPGTDEPRHLIPSGTILLPGGIYVVFGGTVNDDDADLANIIAAFPTVIFQRASSGSLDLTNASDEVIINDASGTNVISFKPDDLMLNMSINSSVTRKASISDPTFVRHSIVEKAYFSPGKLVYFTANNSPLVLNEFLMDPGTSDTNGDGTVSNGEDEFLEFINISGADLDLSGFKVTDEGGYLADSPRHIVPAGTIIPDGGVYLLFGGGTPDATRGGTIPNGNFGGSIFQASSSNTLNMGNSGDGIFILDNSDNVIFAYDSNEAGLAEGDDQSITRNPDITGTFVLHTTTPSGEPNSPGFRIDGSVVLSVANGVEVDKNLVIYQTNNNALKVSGLQKENANIQIYDVSGREILKSTVSTNQNNEIVLPKVSTGIYIISILTDNVRINRKIILK